jgi:hypothetical protein
MREVRRSLVLGVLCTLALGSPALAALSVSGPILNQGGGTRTGGSATISNDALGDAAVGRMTSASGRFRMEPYGGLHDQTSVISEVSGLRLDGPPDATIVSWTAQPAASAYHLYRAIVPTAGPRVPPVFDAYECGLPQATFEEWQYPAAGEYYAYVVTAVSGGEESSMGVASNGVPRVEGTPCP